MLELGNRLSKVEVVSYAREIHNDEYGISCLCNTMLTSEEERVSYNAAWILFHLSKEDKAIYLTAFYDRIADMAMSSNLNIRRGLILSIIADMPVGENFRTDLLDFCLEKMLDKKECDSTRSVMIKLAAKICKAYPELINELKVNLEYLLEDPKRSISAASKNALKFLKSKSHKEVSCNLNNRYEVFQGQKFFM